MGRINLYVSDALEKRMGAFRDRLNWSQIAQEAFDHAVRIEEAKGTSMEAAGIERLRASRVRTADLNRASGYESGKSWALNVAEYDELQRVASMDIGSLPEDDSGRAAYDLAVAILGDESPDRGDICQALEAAFSNTSVSYDEVAGFIEAATEVYAEV